MKLKTYLSVALLVGVGRVVTAQAAALECGNWKTAHPDWLWCDDFESDSALESNYFEVDRAGGRFGVVSGTSVGGNASLKGTYTPGNEGAGNVKWSFGRTPVSPRNYTDKDYTDVYWRVYAMVAPGWQGNAMKITRAIQFAASNWAEASTNMLWEDTASGLSIGIDPVSGVKNGTVVTTKYNDFANFKWLGHVSATTPIYSSANQGKWFCIETRMKLNTPGQSDGVGAVWIDGKLEAEKTGIDYRGTYTQYGINAIFLENWINSGPSQQQVRYFDNFVVSTKPIGCGAGSPTVKPSPPANVRTS